MTAEIGRVLGGRYRLIAPIGMGASAQVYLADDVKLRRRVAVKMLHDALAGDADFLRRFRAEARAAAALSHPNVMAVYDWADAGDEGGVAFIVTEYLPGGSLRALLDSGALLTPAQALGVGVEAARALDYAHRRGFVHRDIKPANLLFGEDQRLRIADFGLARALAEAAWTEPQGAVLGTARYASPELAKGEALTGKADVYSLALVLVEAVTGEVPFVADTTLGTLMARVDRPLPVPEALGPLRSILVQAGNPDPDQRIDARTLAKGLLRAARDLSRPPALPLVGAIAAGAAVASDLDPTLHAPGPLADGPPAPANDLTADDLELDPPHWVNQAAAPDSGALPDVGDAGGAPAEADAEAETGGSAATGEAPDEQQATGPVATGVPVVSRGHSDQGPGGPAPDDGRGAAEAAAASAALAASAAAIAAEPGLAPDEVVGGVPWGASPGDDPDRTDQVARAGAANAYANPNANDVAGGGADGASSGHGRRRWPWVALVVALLLGAGGAAAAVVATRDDKPAAAPLPLPVPGLVGRTQAQAAAVAEAAGWKVAVRELRRDGTTRGEVLATAPKAGVRLREGGTLTLTVSAGQTIVAVPGDLAGKPLTEAQAALEAVGLRATVADQPFSEDVPEGVVVQLTDGTPSRLEKGTAVGLVVSKGPEPRTIPGGLVGHSQADVTKALQDLGLKVAIVETFSDDVKKGTVISTLPRAGEQAAKGSTVSVEVSQGPHLVAVPDVSKASSISQAVSILEAAGLKAGDVQGPAAGKPKSTSPKKGTMVPKGSTVDIRLG
jgi:serine/threonine-protein kinase